MPQMEKLQSYKLLCEGGLDSNKNYLQLSEKTPGAATSLINFESSLYGGYRRISGFANFEAIAPVIDPTNGTGAVLGLAIYASTGVIAARAQTVGGVYKFYQWVSNAPWSAFTTGLTLNSAGVRKIRSVNYNFSSKNSMMFADGVNNASLYNGTTWTHISSAATGANFANAGGPMALNAPQYVSLFKNTLFMSGDSTNPQVVAYSAPSADYDWTAASGAGQIVMGFPVVAIKPFRDALFVFGTTKIKKIVLSGTTFVINDVADNIGCLASDSVVEIDADLQFLSQDGFRTVGGTNRIGDVELGVLSKNIQQDVIDLISGADLPSINSVVIKQKSQVRCFFSNSTLSTDKNVGIIGCLKVSQAGYLEGVVNGTTYGTTWEWGRLQGIRTAVVDSGYIGGTEYVLHGDFDGTVYRQEVGNSFAGATIPAAYSTPYLDYGEVYVRKTNHRVTFFVRPEGNIQLSLNVQYDYDSITVLNPTVYVLSDNSIGVTYGTGVYGTSMYATTPSPIIQQTIEGSGFATKITISTNDTNASYSIQGIVLEYAIDGRK